MALERDYSAERLARIDALLSDARHALTTPLDRKVREDLCARLDAMLKELGAVTRHTVDTSRLRTASNDHPT